MGSVRICTMKTVVSLTGFAMTDFASLYSGFHSPIAELNCGDRCAPYNERGVPFCCDTRHAVPTAYLEEWEYLRLNTDLWHLWDPGNPAQQEALQKQTPKGQVLVECLGHTLCQRNYRALTCRAFPFFPYITREGEFIGLSTYWEYEDRCWVISNQQVVLPDYLAEFVHTYERLFELKPEELANFHYFSTQMRRRSLVAAAALLPCCIATATSTKLPRATVVCVAFLRTAFQNTASISSPPKCLSPTSSSLYLPLHPDRLIY